MNISKSWKDAIEFLMPYNLKPFLLVTGKTIFDIYTSINKPLTSRGNWFVILVLVLLVGLTNIIRMFHLFFLSTLMLNGIHYFLFFIFLLGMRPSIGIKDEDYFTYYFKKYWYLLVATILFGIFYLYVIPFAFIIYMLFLLFAFDSDGSPASLLIALRNSGKMVIYNFPVFLVLFLLLLIIGILVHSLVGFALGYFEGFTIATVLYIVFTPIEVAFIMNLYIKFLHSQPALYFNQPE